MCHAIAAFLLGFGLLAQAQSPGDLDTSFNPGTGADWRVLDIARQTDGKLVVGGQFSTFNGQRRNRITRLNENGSTDLTFDTGTGADSSVNAVAIAPDGKILIGGDFYSFNGASRYRLVRLNASGSVDASFALAPGADGTVQAITVQADGKVLIAGSFTAVNGTARNRVARLNTDGSLDASFNPGSGPNGAVLTITQQTDGKILIGGYFASVNGTTRNRVARLNNDGTLDPGFVPGTLDNGYVKSVSLTADGKVFIAGGISVGLKSRILRLLANGAVDDIFNPGNNAISSDVSTAIAQSDGKVLIGGYFESVSGVSRNGIARLNSDGSLDPAFNPGAGANQLVWTLLLQPDGRLVAGGAFTTYAGVPRNRITRIHNDGASANQAPQMAAIGSLTILEDSGPQSVPVTGITPGPAGETAQSVTNVTAVSSNPSLIPHPSVTYTSGAPTATLGFTPAANANGSVTISVVAQDNGGTANGGVDRVTNSFTVTVTPVNDAPLVVLQARPTTVGFFNDANFVWSSEFPAGGALLTNLGVAVVPFTDFASAVGAYPVIVVPSMHTALAPTLNAAARASISNFVNTGGVLVVMGNHVPAVQVADLMNAVFGYSLVPYRLLAPSVQAVSAAGTPFADDPPWIWANDQESYAFSSLPSNARVIYQRDGVGWDESSVTVFSVGTGRAVTLGGQFSQTFIWSGEGTWLPVLASAITPILLDIVVSEDTDPQTITGFASASRSGPTNELAQRVSFLVSNDNNGLFSSQPAIAANGTLSFTPAPNANGSATVAVRAHDDDGTANGGVDTSAPQTFTITVTPVNDAPTLAAIGVSGTEDTTLTFTAANFTEAYSDVEGTPLASITVVTLPATGTLKLSGVDVTAGQVIPAADLGNLTYVPVANENGAKTFTVTASDGSLSSSVATVTMTLAPLNDAPSFALAPVGREGRVVAWGLNSDGQTTVPSPPLLAVAICAKGNRTLALKSDGTVVAWGINNHGQGSVPPGLSGVVAVSAGDEHNLSLKSDGTVVAWGRNQVGQTDVPPGLSGVVAISGGSLHNLALRSDGTVTAWGGNNYGQGIVPPGLTGVVAISAGSRFNLALLNNGTVVAWGDNSYHETEVPAGLSGVVAIAAGAEHALALKADGTVVAWGRNTFGTGDTGTGLSEVPVGLAGVVAIAANGEHNLALKSDGTVVTWGRNEEGQTDVPVGLSGVVAISAGFYHSAVLANATGSPRLTALEDAGPQTVPGVARNFSAGAPQESAQQVSFTVTNDNNALFLTQPAVAANGTLTFTPAANAYGSAMVTVIAVDNGGAPGVSNSAPQTFTITVAPVSDAPVVTLAGNVTVAEDSGAYGGGASFASFSDANDTTPASSPLTGVYATVTSYYDAAFSPVLFTADGRMYLAGTEVANWSYNRATRRVDFNWVYAPGVTLPGYFTATLHAGSGLMTSFSGALRPRPQDGYVGFTGTRAADASTNALVGYTVSNNNPGLFSTQPAIDTGGTLTFTPAANANGVATVTVVAQDNGGTANGGVDKTTNSFLVTVTAVNDAPSFALPALTVQGPYTVRGCCERESARC